MATPPDLPIDALNARHPGLTKAVASAYREAATVCLDRHHQPPAEFVVNGMTEQKALLCWQPPDAHVRGAWANETDATEFGAYACVLSALELDQGLVAVRRAETLTGADYYVAPLGTDPADLEDCWRLEVSGVDHGARGVVDRRLREKLGQTERGASNVPAIAGVVGFKAQIVVLARATEPV